MKPKHATVKLGDYNIPLIGVDYTATEEECDLCGDIKHLKSIELTDIQFLCERCRREPTTTNKGPNESNS